ncbi:MAG: hypothetical protein WBK20_14040, partial [Spirochaetota bacterium]
MKKLIILLLVLFPGCSSFTSVSQQNESLYTQSSDTTMQALQIADNLEFNEVWAYLMRGEEDRMKGNEPITDLCYFSAKVSGKGQITGDYAPPSIKFNNKIRHHIVIAVIDNFALLHFILNPDLPVRKNFINDVCRISSKF